MPIAVDARGGRKGESWLRGQQKNARGEEEGAGARVSKREMKVARVHAKNTGVLYDT